MVKNQDLVNMKDRREYQRNYSKGLKGRLVRCYNHMYQRCNGNHIGYKRYKGLDVLSRDDFYNYSLNDKDYLRLHSDWVNSNYKRGLCPSIDRIDSSRGYTLDNIRWVTHSENSRLGSVSRWSKEKYKETKY